jgi:hypothetical protein
LPLAPSTYYLSIVHTTIQILKLVVFAYSISWLCPLYKRSQVLILPVWDMAVPGQGIDIPFTLPSPNNAPPIFEQSCNGLFSIRRDVVGLLLGLPLTLAEPKEGTSFRLVEISSALQIQMIYRGCLTRIYSLYLRPCLRE